MAHEKSIPVILLHVYINCTRYGDDYYYTNFESISHFNMINLFLPLHAHQVQIWDDYSVAVCVYCFILISNGDNGKI